MKRIALLSVAITVSVWASSASAATRPHYGGTLHLALSATPMSLDPAETGQVSSVSLQSVSRLMFDTLVRLDEHGVPHPWLASSWQAEPGNRRWQFTIRRGVTFADGSPVNPDALAASVRSANPQWKVSPGVETVTIECGSPHPVLPAELAQARYGIAKRDKKLIGSGAFGTTNWVPGKELTLTARDDYWNGRVFVDTIEIEFGKTSRDQMIAFDVGKLDLVEVTAESAFNARDHRIERSAPVEWIGLVFTRNPLPEENGLREALSLSIDRPTINNVLLRGAAEITGSLLPQWMSGYSFLLPAKTDFDRARELRNDSLQSAPMTLSFDASDPLLRLIAERIALNAKDAGIKIQLTSASPSDIRLLRLTPSNVDPHVALADLLARMSLPAPAFDNTSMASLFAAEKAVLDSQRLIPLFASRSTVALGNAARGWQEHHDGQWPLENVWLAMGTP